MPIGGRPELQRNFCVGFGRVGRESKSEPQTNAQHSRKQKSCPLGAARLPLVWRASSIAAPSGRAPAADRSWKPDLKSELDFAVPFCGPSVHRAAWHEPVSSRPLLPFDSANMQQAARARCTKLLAATQSVGGQSSRGGQHALNLALNLNPSWSVRASSRAAARAAAASDLLARAADQMASNGRRREQMPRRRRRCVSCAFVFGRRPIV